MNRSAMAASARMVTQGMMPSTAPMMARVTTVPAVAESERKHGKESNEPQGHAENVDINNHLNASGALISTCRRFVGKWKGEMKTPSTFPHPVSITSLISRKTRFFMDKRPGLLFVPPLQAQKERRRWSLGRTVG